MILENIEPSIRRNGFVVTLKGAMGEHSWYSDVFIPANTRLANCDIPLTPLNIALAIKDGYFKICSGLNEETAKISDSLIEKLRDAEKMSTKKKTIKSKRLRRKIRS